MSESFVDQYLELANEGADFDHPRLAQLRELMTEEEHHFVVERLRAAADAAREEANALREWHRSRKVVPLRH